MTFTFDYRPSDSPFVDMVWHTQTEGGGGTFTSQSESRWEMVITKQYGKTNLTLRGPENRASSAGIPENGEFFGIVFKLGTFMPVMPTIERVNSGINLPDASGNSFWLNGSAWQFPDFENADTFVNRLMREGLLVRDNLVDAILKERPRDVHVRTVRRHFLQATGLTYKEIQQIERAKQALSFLQQGKSILDTVYETGYYDQPHMTKSLKHFVGQTPAQILTLNRSE